MGKKLAVILTGLGVFVLGVALLARFYAYDQLAVVPLDQDTTSVSVGPGRHHLRHRQPAGDQRRPRVGAHGRR